MSSFSVSKLLMVAFIGCVAVLGGCVDDAGESPATDQVEQASGAVWSCTNWSAVGQGPRGGANSIAADCQAVDGSWRRTEAWMPGCVGNQNGLLVWSRNGFFDRSCSNCYVDARDSSLIFFICNCSNAAGSWGLTGININGLTNSNGNLVCP